MSCLIRSALLVVSFSAASVNCSANLGDTLDQSIKRFGQPISHGKGDSTDAGYPWYAFKYGGCEIEELFDGSGIVRIETYWKKDRSAITEKEQKEILQTESSNAKWGKPKISDASTIWLRDDGANAMYSHDFHELSLCGGIRKH